MNLDEIKELMKEFDASGVSTLELEIEEVRLKLKKAAPVQAASVQAPVMAAPPLPVVQPAIDDGAAAPADEGTVVTAPLVGVFYKSPSPGATPFVAVGQQVKQGETICLIEAMKMVNEVPAPCDGTVEKIMVSDGVLVAYEEPLVVIRES